MFVIDEKTAAIAVSKGDSAYFSILLEGDVPEDGVIAMFTVKKKVGESAAMIKKYEVTDGVVWIGLTSQDTNKLEPGNYIWDLRVILSDTEVVTPMTPGRFCVLEVAGDV